MNVKNLLVVSAMSLFSIAITQPASAQNVQNGGFETGSFPPWTILESNNAPRIRTDVVHSGTYSALLGNIPPESEALGNSTIQSNLFNLPANAMLSYWWNGFTIDSITFDWQDAYITSAGGTILFTAQHTCTTTNGFVNVNIPITGIAAGTPVHVEFLVHQDGFGDDTNMYVDDVAVVPEPSVASLGLLGFGVLAATGIARRMRRSAA
jgi:hypothetical protein